MSDQLVKGLALNGNVRVFVAKTTRLVEQARKYHDTYPVASAALGRVLSVSAILGSTLKSDDEKYVVEIRGDGELQHILANADNSGHVRGLVSQPHLHQINPVTGKLDVGGVIGNGTLSVTRESENRQSFSSQVPLQTGEIGDDFVYYFAQSEQIPSALSVGVLVNEDFSIKGAGAVWVQVLPSATEADIENIESVFAALPPVSDLMVEQEAIDVFYALFDDVKILETQDLFYFCGCNKTQMRDVLRTLSNAELQELIDKDHGATLVCHYCNSKYKFTEEDLLEMIHETEAS